MNPNELFSDIWIPLCEDLHHHPGGLPLVGNVSNTAQGDNNNMFYDLFSPPTLEDLYIYISDQLTGEDICSGCDLTSISLPNELRYLWNLRLRLMGSQLIIQSLLLFLIPHPYFSNIKLIYYSYISHILPEDLQYNFRLVQTFTNLPILVSISKLWILFGRSKVIDSYQVDLLN